MIEPPRHAVAARVVAGLFHVAVSVGVDRNALLDALGVGARGIEHFDDWIPVETALDFWHALVRVSGDPLIAFTIADRIPLGVFGLAFHSSNASQTLGDALDRLLRYHRITATPLRLTLADEDTCRRIRVGFATGIPTVPTALPEYLVALVLRASRSITGAPIRPIEVTFAHAPQRPTREYEMRLDAPVRFGSARHEIAIRKKDLAINIPTADPVALAALDRAALAALPPASTVTDRVRRAIVPLLEQGEPRMGTVARALRCSPRSLQRWLAEDRTSFAALVDDVRREQALAYIPQVHLGVTEIAFLAGFADSSAFFRAFRRWTGNTPAEYRKRLSAT